MGLEPLLIIPLIALAVWIFQYIFKVQEDPKNQPVDRARPRPRPRPPAGERPRRPVTDLDRYLEESRRRRGEEPELEPVVVAELAPESRPSRPPPPPRQPRPERAERAERRPTLEPTVRTVRPSPASRDTPVLATIVPTTVAPLDQPAPQMQIISRVESEGPKESRVALPRLSQGGTRLLGVLLPLLRTGQGAALAVVLSEIMQPPKSMRNR